MTELDRVDSRDNFNLRGVPLCLQIYKRRLQTSRKKRWNNCTDGSATYLSKNVGASITKFWVLELPVCPVNDRYMYQTLE